MLIGKSDNDDRLINALRLEVEAQKQVHEKCIWCFCIQILSLIYKIYHLYTNFIIYNDCCVTFEWLSLIMIVVYLILFVNPR